MEYTIKIWEEAAASQGYQINKITCNAERNVTKVHGLVSVLQKVKDGEKKVWKQVPRNVRWDSTGRCFMGTHNTRKKEFDLNLAAYAYNC